MAALMLLLKEQTGREHFERLLAIEAVASAPGASYRAEQGTKAWSSQTLARKCIHDPG